tara:strand:- start:1396 stop:1701 length:306 start_codon:yes stop_codon:yes gene_type:complete
MKNNWREDKELVSFLDVRPDGLGKDSLIRAFDLINNIGCFVGFEEDNHWLVIVEGDKEMGHVIMIDTRNQGNTSLTIGVRRAAVTAVENLITYGPTFNYER